MAHCEQTKELSGLGSLEEINRLGGADLLGFKGLSAGRAVQTHQSGAAGGGIGAVEHRGGAARTGTGEYLQGLSVASGSLAEAETQVTIANRLEMLSLTRMECLLTRAEEISKMLSGLKRSLGSRR